MALWLSNPIFFEPTRPIVKGYIPPDGAVKPVPAKPTAAAMATNRAFPEAPIPTVFLTKRREREIISQVCAEHSISRQDLLSGLRTKWAVRARKDAALRLRELYPESLSAIGRVLHLHHTSVLHLLGGTKKSRKSASLRLGRGGDVR